MKVHNTDLPNRTMLSSTPGLAEKPQENVQKVSNSTGLDGWIPWSGGECPVPADTYVEYKMGRRQALCPERAEILRWQWTNNGQESDIIAYRLCKPKRQLGYTEANIRDLINKADPAVVAVVLHNLVTRIEALEQSKNGEK